MPRKERAQSGIGIYHVMLRGINRQDIFEEAEDYKDHGEITGDHGVGSTDHFSQ